MPKRPISVTLDADNLLWLKGQRRATRARSISETLDRLVTEARRAGRVADAGIRSVLGTVDIAPDDPDLAGADAALRELFDASLDRPLTARERPRRARRSSGRSRGRG